VKKGMEKQMESRIYIVNLSSALFMNNA